MTCIIKNKLQSRMDIMLFLLIFLFSSLYAGDNSPVPLSTRNDSAYESVMRIDLNSLKKVLDMRAIQALAKSNKAISTEELLKNFYDTLQSKPMQERLMKPYREAFSQEEIKEIKVILENPNYKKYHEHSIEIYKAELEVAQNLLEEIINQLDQQPNTEESVIIEVNAKNYQQALQQASKPIVLAICAEWCSPCQSLKLVLKELAKESKTALFMKVDFDTNPELVKKFGVQSLPTILFIQPNGKILEKSVGFLTKQELHAKIETFLKS